MSQSYETVRKVIGQHMTELVQKLEAGKPKVGGGGCPATGPAPGMKSAFYFYTGQGELIARSGSTLPAPHPCSGPLRTVAHQITNAMEEFGAE